MPVMSSNDLEVIEPAASDWKTGIGDVTRSGRSATNEGADGLRNVKRPRAGRMAKTERAAMIRKCALRVVARHGIGNTNHPLVAAEAQTSVATVFFYFPTHMRLLEYVLEDVAAFLLNDIVRKVADAAANAHSAIERILLAFAESIDVDPDMARVWLDWSTAIRSDVWVRYLAFHQQACGLIRDLLLVGQREGSLRRSIDASDAARVIVGLAHMIAQMKFSGSSTAEVHRAVHVLLLNYIGGGGAEGNPVAAEKESGATAQGEPE